MTSDPPRPATAGELLKRWALDPACSERTFLLHPGGSVGWRETWERSVRYAHLFLRLRSREDLPLHVGVLSENRPEFVYALFGCALAGAVLVGLNPTRRGAGLRRDIEHTDCQILVVDDALVPLLAELEPELPVDPTRVLVCRDHGERPPESERSGGADGRHGRYRDLGKSLAALEVELGPAAGDPPPVEVGPEDWLAIIFTSGSSGAPKAILNSHGKVFSAGTSSSGGATFSARDVFYAAMPLFHSNSLGMALVPALVHGATLAMPRRFSASGFLPDVRRYGATVFNYVGKPLAYILGTPEQPDDADNPLRIAHGAGATARQQEEFARRFGLDRVVEIYGSTESGASTLRREGDPEGSCGAMPPGVEIWDAEDRPCPPAELDAAGSLLNRDAAVGEIVNAAGPGRFEGYYKNEEATAAKMRGGVFRSGDLGYYRVLEYSGRTERFLYFAGRTDDWIRKDGENFLAEAVEEILLRQPEVLVCSVYGVPCAEADELVMAALVLRQGASFDPQTFYQRLVAQPDLSPKWIPDYLRLARALPQTSTLKVLRRELKREGFHPERVSDPLWWRERGERGWKPLAAADWERIRASFRETGREAELG